MALLFEDGIFSVIGLGSELQVGARLAWYVANTDTPANTYTTAALNVPNTNPVLAQADGRFPAIWLAPGDYKFKLSTPGGVEIKTVDNFNVPNSPPSFSAALTGFLSGNQPLPIASGGTGNSSAVNAIAALGGFPATGGTVSGNIVRSAKGVHFYWNDASLNSGNMFLTSSSAPDPRTPLPGQIWMKYT